MTDFTARRAVLAENLARLEERIGGACDAAGRDRDEVTLIVVTKFHPASDVRLLADLGVRHIAENRDQEAAAKAAECAGLPLTWHFVGQLQTNKARSVASYADVVHSVDRPRLVGALDTAAERRGRRLDCLVQVALDAGADAESTAAGGTAVGGPGGRGGAAPEAVPAVADAIAKAQSLRLAGVMTVAPLAGPYAGRPSEAFELLREISTGLCTRHPAATMVSAGMSSDLEEAVAAGATHVRVGSAVLGERPRLR